MNLIQLNSKIGRREKLQFPLRRFSFGFSLEVFRWDFPPGELKRMQDEASGESFEQKPLEPVSWFILKSSSANEGNDGLKTPPFYFETSILNHIGFLAT
ncbi:hypothetical protein [Leptolyngbya ohadii]|uniref:hypothetical protein n=1 Tax=Leptolyngbya ohadii TaxID=1962290 RepID=UPI000B59E4E3|nr:hypothetical protein [Leptolyngbya ohadii]